MVDHEIVNKALTEAMGECTHVWDLIKMESGAYSNLWGCRCGAQATKIHFTDPLPSNNDFFTNEGYGKLVDWFNTWPKEKQTKFISYILKPVLDSKPDDDKLSDFCVIRTMQVFHRGRLAELIYSFLKEGE